MVGAEGSCLRRNDERHAANPHQINRDGRHVGYLQLTEENLHRFAACDRDLWDRLGHLVGMDARCVHCVELAGVLPPDTQFFSGTLTYVPRMALDLKRAVRQAWLDAALRATADADIVMMDPNNGVSQGDARMFQEKGPKFAYGADLRAVWERGQSLVLYHHIGRIGGRAEEQARGMAEWLRDALDAPVSGQPVPDPLPLLFHRGSARVFFVVPQPHHADLLRARVARMLAGPWGAHFELVAAPEPEAVPVG